MKGKHNKFNEREASPYKREFKGIELRSGRRDPFIVLSFRDYDINQGQTFGDWQSNNLLALAISKLQSVCGLTRIEATQQQIIKETFQLVSKRDDNVCNFLEGGRLVTILPSLKFSYKF